MQVGAVRHGVHLEQQEEAPRRSVDALQAYRHTALVQALHIAARLLGYDTK